MFCIILQTIPLNHFTSNWIVSVDKKEWKQPNYFRENFQPFLLSFWYSALVKLRHSIPSKLHLSVCLPFLHIALLFSVFGKGSDNLSILLQKCSSFFFFSVWSQFKEIWTRQKAMIISHTTKVENLLKYLYQDTYNIVCNIWITL